MQSSIIVRHHTLTCAVGRGIKALDKSLDESKSGLTKNDFPHCELETWIGRVEGVEQIDTESVVAGWQSRNNSLAMLGYMQDQFPDEVASKVKSLGAHRIGIVVGTSTSSIGRTEEAYRHLNDQGELSPEYVQKFVHTPHSLGDFMAKMTGITGPSMTISTACSSSGKVFATATRWLNSGIVDAVLVGGVDSLCLSVLQGFHSLQLVSKKQCRPFDEHRDGINLGEAAGFALLETAAPNSGDLVLCGYGESSDAHHMSHPHPEGLGAEMAMLQALERADLTPADIGYINLHGTASLVNDSIETSALKRLFPTTTRASSTKGWTGHTLGAAGIVEAVMCLQSLKNQKAPGTLNLQSPDPGLDFPVMLSSESLDLKYAMSNSFGFGGNNSSIIFGRLFS